MVGFNNVFSTEIGTDQYFSSKVILTENKFTVDEIALGVHVPILCVRILSVFLLHGGMLHGY